MEFIMKKLFAQLVPARIVGLAIIFAISITSLCFAAPGALAEAPMGNHVKVLVLDKINPGVTEEKIKAVMKEELKTAWEHYKQGYVREWYFRQDRPGVVLVLECDSLEQARAMTDELPLAKAGLVEFELIPLGPFAPLEMLFAK